MPNLNGDIENFVEREKYRNLNQHGQTSGSRIDFFAAVQGQCFLLKFDFVFAVFFLQVFYFWLNLFHLGHAFVRLVGYGEHNQSQQSGKQQDCPAHVANEIVQKVKTLILCGATAPAIRKAVEDAPGFAESGLEVIETHDLAAAVAAAQAAATSGDIVVLSPACAAFDQFKNFMERGQVFKSLVQAL